MSPFTLAAALQLMLTAHGAAGLHRRDRDIAGRIARATLEEWGPWPGTHYLEQAYAAAAGPVTYAQAAAAALTLPCAHVARVWEQAS
jgi:hypothetical protein